MRNIAKITTTKKLSKNLYAKLEKKNKDTAKVTQFSSARLGSAKLTEII